MNEQDRLELDWLKRRQARLEEELRLLSRQLVGLESRLKEPAPEKAPGADIKPIEMRRQGAQPPAKTPAASTVPPPIPPIIPPTPVIAASSTQIASPAAAPSIRLTPEGGAPPAVI